MNDKLWDSFIYFLMKIGMPCVCFYFSLCSNIFLNTAAEDAIGLEKASNYALAPFQYLFAGKVATKETDGQYRLNQRFEYNDNFYVKTAASIIALPPSLIIGSSLKAISLLCKDCRYTEVAKYKESVNIRSNRDYYASIGINIRDLENAPFIDPPKYKRRPGEEHHMAIEKEGCAAIVKIFKEKNIPFWVDCGTCIGAYRYGGVIPWDYDIDFAVLQPDFDNVMQALNLLDKDKFDVQDWSGRTTKKSHIRVYVKNSPKSESIDIYHHAIDPKKKQITALFSANENIFAFEWWKKRERMMCVPAEFSTVFPLKKAYFDGIEVYIPNDTVTYLQRIYGENIAPAKIYDEVTGQYEKDLSHPYWQKSYVH